MNPEPAVDLSPLDPTRDPQRWEALVARVVTRAVAHARRRLTIGAQLAAWARPALAVAAALALVAWAGAAISSPSSEATRLSRVQVVTDWAYEGAAPSAGQIIEVMGESNGT
ncbi:MAG: hypothetical protein CVU56_23340 [Deltaproteobacteria bacterium HGW-Deltaproteobacteria-14]|nr:MAG: hypothetical protein CVU56_23340 [Deltaproteobacteria bacterium HGW-Deltaproteobacteria-14]